MLKSLHVRDIALVRHLDIQFESGLTVITGESGAGKSIILGALGLVLGERASTDSLRPGAQRAEVSAEFDLASNPSVAESLREQSLDDPDQPGRCLVRRTLGADGRSRAFINGTPVNLTQLRSLTGALIDVHGQHENQRLGDPAVQRELLDDYGVDPELRRACADAYREWQDAARRLERLSNRVRESEDKSALLTYQLEELSAAAPEPGEFEKISAEHRRMGQAQKLLDVAQQALDAIENESALGAALKQLERLDDDHPRLVSGIEALRSALDLTDDAARDLGAYASGLELDPAALAELDERIALLHELARKHRVEPDSLVELAEALSTELESLSTDRSEVQRLEREMDGLERRYRECAARVSEQRRAAGDEFSTAVSACMNTLGIRGGALTLDFRPCEAPHGVENVEFLVVTNPRYPPAPLKQIASGGEQARISLAVQTVAAEKSALPTLVLDEADVGVGGTTADVVGRVLRSLADHTQVLCVTHAPQVAALGRQHLRVHKDEAQDTHIDALPDAARVDELARMLAGAGITEKSRDYARNLLKEATESPLH